MPAGPAHGSLQWLRCRSADRVKFLCPCWESWEDIDRIVELLDPFALQNGYERGEKSPNGLLYANKRVNPDWVLSVSPIGPIGVEISFFPREPGAYESERSKVEEHVNGTIAETMSVIYCDDRQDYGKGRVFGFDGIRL